MRGRQSALKIQISEPDRAVLQGWLRRQKTSVGLARRARGILLLEQGCTYVQTSQQVGLTLCHLAPRGPDAFLNKEWQACQISPARAAFLCSRQRLLCAS